MASSNVFDTIAKRIPIINLLLLTLFFASVFRFVSVFFRHTKSPLAASRELANTRFVAPPNVETDNEIQRELAEEKRESRLQL